MDSGYVEMILYVATGMLAVGGVVVSVNALRARLGRPAPAKHRAVGRKSVRRSPRGYRPPESEPVLADARVPYPAWPADAPRDIPVQKISVREWYEDRYAGNVTEPHDPWRALYESVDRLRRQPHVPA
jgi:hypothetical protein